MEIGYIFETFKSLELNVDKVSYLKELQSMNLPYDINFEKLISYWGSRADS